MRKLTFHSLTTSIIVERTKIFMTVDTLTTMIAFIIVIVPVTEWHFFDTFPRILPFTSVHLFVLFFLMFIKIPMLVILVITRFASDQSTFMIGINVVSQIFLFVSLVITVGTTEINNFSMFFMIIGHIHFQFFLSVCTKVTLFTFKINFLVSRYNMFLLRHCRRHIVALSNINK